jgi:hypothetical protein
MCADQSIHVYTRKWITIFKVLGQVKHGVEQLTYADQVVVINHHLWAVPHLVPWT